MMFYDEIPILDNGSTKRLKFQFNGVTYNSKWDAILEIIVIIYVQDSTLETIVIVYKDDDPTSVEDIITQI